MRSEQDALVVGEMWLAEDGLLLDLESRVSESVKRSLSL